MFYLLLLFMGPGSSSRGPPLPILGLWVGKSKVWGPLAADVLQMPPPRWLLGFTGTPLRLHSGRARG